MSVSIGASQIPEKGKGSRLPRRKFQADEDELLITSLLEVKKYVYTHFSAM